MTGEVIETFSQNLSSLASSYGLLVKAYRTWIYIAGKSAGNIAESAILPAILLTINIASNIAGNITGNIADSSILLGILLGILLIIQQYCRPYGRKINNNAGNIVSLGKGKKKSTLVDWRLTPPPLLSPIAKFLFQV